jgi:cbb3-type cytochrome oxidase subunit 1
MPPLTRWMIKTSLVYFLLALLAGIALAARQAFGLTWITAGLTPVYLHLFLVGWLTLLIFGVVYWMFPKFSRENPRGSEFLGWASFLLINAGLILRTVGEAGRLPLPEWGWVLALSALLQWAAGLAFVVNTWPRVKEK